MNFHQFYSSIFHAFRFLFSFPLNKYAMYYNAIYEITSIIDGK